MDPALRELLRSEDPGEGRMVEAIIRLRRPGLEVPGVRIVSRFGTIVTCRLPAESVPEVRRHRDVISLKAPRTLGPELDKSNPTSVLRDTTIRRHTDRRRPPGLPLTGSGVVCGFADWGMDFDHPNFKRPDGTTRLLTLWDQRDQVGGARAEPYGYGVIHSRDLINEALRGARPYDALGYRPTGADHGTHVADIAAGNGSAGGPVGIAPGADLVFVHLADRGTGGLSDLGDSRRLLEAVDFIAHAAGARPWVINVSVGRMGGSHDGCSPCELAFDELLGAAPGRFIVQSAGNYRRAGTHTSGLLTSGGAQTFTLVTNPADTTANELEVWYDGDDIFTVRIESPTGATVTVALDDEADLHSHGQVAGRVYHRACDPNNGDNHIDAFLYPWAPPGRWQVTLHAERARHGRFDAWIERDEECGPCQARFAVSDRNRLGTTGTIANGHLPLVVGAHDAHSRARAVAGFSSVGPTRDGRAKPDLVAPGMAVLAARAEPEAGSRSRGLLMRKSGTSMAAPHVTGAVALCLQAGGHRLGAKQIRDLILGSVDSGGPRDRTLALGRGRLNISRLCADLHRTYPIGNLYEHREPVMDAAEFDARLPLAAMPSSAYRELLYRPTGDIARWIRQRFDTVARPGEAPAEAPQPGDLVLIVALGRPGVGECVVLAGAGLTRRARDGQQGSGWYGKVTSPTSAAGPHEYRILDAAGRTPPGRLLLRRHSDFGGGAEFDAESPPAVPVDTAAAVPPFNTAERAIVLEPLLTPTQSAAAVAWSTRMHPTTSGVTLDDIGGALTNYVDATAVQAAIVRRNTQDPAHRIDASAPLAVPVIVECVHQFQRKCYLDLNQHDGQAGESTLDSLGLIARTGPGMRGARRRHDGAQQRLNARDRAVQAATANEFSAANWFDRMTDPSVFGLTTKLGFGLHLVLVRKLRQAERFLLTLPAFRGMTPAQLGSALGLSEKHGGARPTDATTTSLHSLGLAIDISFLANPWVRRDASWQALTRAASLITGTNLAKGSAGAYLSGLGTDPARSTGQVWDELDQRNAELIGYLGLDGPALRAMLFDRAQGWATTVLNPGETLDQAVRRWRNSIRDDTRRLQAGDFKGHESPAKGFLTHPRDLAIALREHGCLAWGGVDFGPSIDGSGDMMHFDARIDGVGRVLSVGTAAWVPEPGHHPCAPAPTPPAENEDESEQTLPSIPATPVRDLIAELKARRTPAVHGGEILALERLEALRQIVTGAINNRPAVISAVDAFVRAVDAHPLSSAHQSSIGVGLGDSIAARLATNRFTAEADRILAHFHSPTSAYGPWYRGTRTSFVAKGSGYFPNVSTMEGGFLDRLGQPLHTLQDFQNGRAVFVSVAMDAVDGPPYGTRLIIAEFPGAVFRVVDTGAAFTGKGMTRIDICTANEQASKDKTINGELHLEFAISLLAPGPRSVDAAPEPWTESDNENGAGRAEAEPDASDDDSPDEEGFAGRDVAGKDAADPPIRTTDELQKAWSEYECAGNRMIPLRLFDKWTTPVNPLTVTAWRALEHALVTTGYPVHRAWVYECRNIEGKTARSLHAYGLAIDIDHAGPKCNANRATPDGRAVRFSTGTTKQQRCRDVDNDVADTSFSPEQVAAVEAIRTRDGRQVFAWGGRWRTPKDTMHFQINVTPDELAKGIRTSGDGSAGKAFPLPSAPSPPETGTACEDNLRKLSVAVVGGGLAGLMAARTLTRKGMQVSLFEARTDVGGRVYSNTTFSRGRITEFGAELIGSIHTTWCRLAADYGLGLISRSNTDLYRGQQLNERRTLDKPLSMDEIRGVDEEKENRVFRPIAAMAAGIPDPDPLHPWSVQPWLNSGLRRFDTMSVAYALEKICKVQRSERLWKEMELLLVNDQVAPLEEQNFLGLLCLVKGGQSGTIGDPLMGYWDELEIYRCADGAQRLAFELANEIRRNKGRVLRQAAVTNISLGEVVTVTWRGTKRSGGTLQPPPMPLAGRFDYVIFAIPPNVWKNVTITPAHPKDIIGVMGSGDAVKFFTDVPDRFWLKDLSAPYGGSLTLGQVWQGTDNQTRVDQQGIVLSAFAGARSPTEGTFKRELKKLFKNYPTTAKTALANWPTEPFIETGYVAPKLGQIWTVGRKLNEPFQGRMYFAGEHTQMNHLGYMEGALRSGERVANELMKHACEPAPQAAAGVRTAATGGR